MELKNKFFIVHPHVSEEHLATCLNNLARENYVLYNIYSEESAGEHSWFSVVAYKDAMQLAEEKWARESNTTGGHANE